MGCGTGDRLPCPPIPVLPTCLIADSNVRRRTSGLRSRVAARPAFEGSSRLGPRCRGPDLGRAPSSAVDDEAGALFQFTPSPVAPCPSKGSPRQQPHRVTAARALSPSECIFPPFVSPRAMVRVQPASHKALIHCRIRCRSRCCHQVRPDPSLGLRTNKTFSGFAVAKRSSDAHRPRPIEVGVCAEAQRVHPHHRGGSCREPPRRPWPDLRGTLSGSRSSQVRSAPAIIRRRISGWCR